MKVIVSVHALQNTVALATPVINGPVQSSRSVSVLSTGARLLQRSQFACRICSAHGGKRHARGRKSTLSLDRQVRALTRMLPAHATSC